MSSFLFMVALEANEEKNIRYSQHLGNMINSDARVDRL